MELILASITDIMTPGAGDEESWWMQLLVFVVVGAIWLLGSIAKARSDKAEAARRQERQASRPQPQSNAARERQLAARRARLEQQMRQRQAQAQAARAQQKTRPLQTYKRPPQTKPRPTPTVVLEPEPPRHLLQIEAPKLKSSGLAATPMLKPTKPLPPLDAKVDFELPGFLPDIAGPDDLRAAVLYHEILGMPLALREEWIDFNQY